MRQLDKVDKEGIFLDMDHSWLTFSGRERYIFEVNGFMDLFFQEIGWNWCNQGFFLMGLQEYILI